MRACTKAWGRLPRIWCWVTSYSSLNSSGGPLAARVRSNQRAAARVFALLVQGEGGEESAEQEGSFGVGERAVVVAEAVGVAVVGEVVAGRRAGWRWCAGRRRGMAPRSPGSSRAASTAGSSGERCQCPSGCRAWAAVSAMMRSASALQRRPARGPGLGGGDRAQAGRRR